MFRYNLLCTRVFLILAILGLTTAIAFGQTTAARPDRGTAANGAYSVSDIENINLQNGNVSLDIPLASLPPIAGGKLSWGLNAQYNSKIWDVVRTQQIGEAFDLSEEYYVVDTVQQSDRGGWRVTGQYSMDIRDAHLDFDYQIPPVGDEPDRTLMINNSWYKAVLVMPDGSEHEMRPVDYSPFSGGKEYLFGYYSQTPFTHGAMRYYSFDGSFIYATITNYDTWTAYLPDGTRVIQAGGIQRIQDTNGNKIKIFSDSNGTHYQDEQTGREIRYFYDPAGNGGKGQGQVWYQAVGGTWMHVDLNFDTTTVQGKLYTVNDWDPGQVNPRPCIHKRELSESLQVIREIVLPQTEPTQPARRFTFTYNSDATESATTSMVSFSCSGSGTSYTRTSSKGWGSLSKMVTPTGAEVQYAYLLDSGSLQANSVFNPDDIAGETITKKTIVQDGPDDVWTYVIWPDLGSASQTYVNDNSVISENSYAQMGTLGTGYGGTYYGVSGLVYRTTKPFQKIERHWSNLIFTGASLNSPGGTVVFNPVVDTEYMTLTDASGNNLKMAAKKFQYDFNGNVTQTTEYDWFDPALVSRDSNGVPTAVPAGATVLRVTNNSYYNSATTASSANVYAKRPLASPAPLILNALKETTAGSSIAQTSYDGQAYGVAPTIGNATSRKVWVNLDSKWITTSSTYDSYGNVLTATDGLGKVTQFFYDDTAHALPTRVVVDPQNGTGTQTSAKTYDYSTGLVLTQTDVNGQITNIDYTNQLLGTVDPFGRPGITKAPQINISGVNHRKRVTATYVDSARQVIIASDLFAENDKLLKVRTTTDALNRPVLSEQTEDGSNYTISTKTAYLDMGRVTLTSSAMRAATSSTDSWTRVTKDSAGRVVEVANFAGATQPAWTGTAGVFTGAVTTAYDANFSTVTDQGGKLRRSMVDGLGRLLRVDEPDGTNSLGSTAAPVQATSYAYDVLGNLTTVTQGSQTRTFTYDSLSRLRTSVNPESGTLTYQYDDNSNLRVKTDARNVSTHFEYDSLNRVTRRWYNGSNSLASLTHNSPALPAGVGTTDEVKFYYDSQALPVGAPAYTRGSAVGRLVAQTYGSGSNGDYFAYDVLGRPTLKFQQTGTVNYQVSAAYNLTGALTTLTYPSGHTVTNTFDQAARLTAVSGNLGDGTTRTYSSGILYSPLGGLVKEQFGTTSAIYNKLFFNSRGQLAEIRESTSYTGPTDYDANRGAIINSYSNLCTGLCSGSSMSDNNGNLLKQDIQIPSVATRTQFYDYDTLSRLTSAREVLSGVEQWKQQFTYDRWGNRLINTGVTYGAGINNKAFTVNTANNRLGVPVGQSGTMSYDASGNLTTDTYTGVGGRTYDAENKMTQAADFTGQISRYTYDGEGKRVRRQVASGQEDWQVYGFAGELLAEYRASAPASSPQKEYGYRNGQLLIAATGRFNVALAANGAVATASSTATSSGFSTTGAINGNYRGPWGLSLEGWNDNTPNVVPDWIQVDFAGSKAIDEISVFSLHDNYTVENTPTETQTFSLYGLLNFDVQYWNGSSWVTVPGGNVTGNNKVWRKFTFSPITTSKIRVNITAVPDAWSRVVEIQAFGTSAGDEKVQWLVSDQVGTPRIIFDQTGNPATIKRHDYLPFGEELFAGTGGRSVAQGYSVGDGVRQQFTDKERDVETGLDYFSARYYASTQGRFTGPDPLLSSGKTANPQSWNRYAYCANQPLIFVDPDGLIWGYIDTEDGLRKYRWYDDENALKAAGATVVTTFIYQAENGNYVTLNPNANQFEENAGRYDARKAFWRYEGLPASWQDWVPVWGQFRKMMFNYATGNYEGALFNFSMASVDGGTAVGGFMAGVGRQGATSAAEQGILRLNQAERSGAQTLFYYTDEATAQAITKSGQIGAPGAKEVFLTNNGNLTPLQAQIELALPAKNTATAVFSVDSQALPQLLRSGRVAGNVFNRAGGGFEFVFNGPVKEGFKRIR
jgi:RHS repeat-associated protein